MNSLYTLHFVGTKAEVSQQPTGQCTSDSPTELLAHGRRRKDQTCSPVAGLQFRIVSTVGVHGPEQRENTSGTDTDQHLKNKNQGDVSFPKPIKDNGKESSQTHGSHVCVFFANTVTDRSCKNHSHNIGSLSHCQIKAAQHKRNAKEGNRGVILFHNKVLEVINRSSVTNRIEYQSCHSGSEQNPPRTVVKQIFQIVFQGVLYFPDRFYPFTCQGETKIKQSRTHHSNHHHTQHPSPLLVFCTTKQVDHRHEEQQSNKTADIGKSHTVSGQGIPFFRVRTHHSQQ